MYFNLGDLVFLLVVIMIFVLIYIKIIYISDIVLWFFMNIFCIEYFIVLILLKI